MSPVVSVRGSWALFALCAVAATLPATPVRADHPCSTDPSDSLYDPLCEQEGELDCDPENSATCQECWDCIDNDGDGLFDCMDNVDAEGNVNSNGGCGAYCEYFGPGGEGAYDQDVDGDGFLDCPLGPPSPTPPIYDCDDTQCSVNSDADEICADGVDNDCDGLVDGADTHCVDGDDDDDSGDDDVAGDDDSSDCDSTNDIEIDCTNGCDDDNDGLVDCDDVDECHADPACEGGSGDDDGDPCSDDDDSGGSDDDTQGPDDDDTSHPPDDDDSAGDDDSSGGGDDDSGAGDDGSDSPPDGFPSPTGGTGTEQGCGCSWAGAPAGAALGTFLVLCFAALSRRRPRLSPDRN